MRTNLVLSIVSVFISLLLVEVIFRLFYQPVEPLQLGDIVEWDAAYYANYTPANNDLGFREAELNETIFADGSVRILFLGDSFTFGQGVPNGADRFSDIIERRLNMDLEGQFHIYNAGRVGTEPHDWLDYLKQLMPIYRPHHIFAIFFIRDGTSVFTSLRAYEEEIRRIKANHTANLFYDYFYLGKFIRNILIEREFSDYYAAQLISGYLGTDKETAQWKTEQQALLKMQQLSRENGRELHLIIFPALISLDENYPFHEVEQEIVRFAIEAKMPVYSLTPGFMGQDDNTLWVSANDQHPNKKGHVIAADKLIDYVKHIINSAN